MKSTYVIQPYLVGSKAGKSLALIIPASVAKEYDINPSTVFALHLNANTKRIQLQQTGYQEKGEDQKELKPAEQGLGTSTQQAFRAQ